MMFQHTKKTMVVAPPSVESICVSDQSRMFNGSSSPSVIQSPSWPRAAPNEPACTPVKLHTARIESTFRTIKFGNFRGKPACLIVIDVRFIYNKKCMMRSANIQLNFTKSLDGSVDDESLPRTTNAYGPIESFGGVESVSSTQGVDLSTPKTIAHCDLPTATIGSKTTRTQNQQWHIQAMEQPSKKGPSQGYSWSIYDNDLSSFESFPRAVTIWMIVEHDNSPFYANMHMDGKLCGHMATNVYSQLNSYYKDKKEISKTLAPGGLVPDLTVDSSLNAAQNVWKCLAAKRGVEGRLFTPAAGTRVSFEEEKLRAALGGQTTGSWSESILKCTEDEGEEVQEVEMAKIFRLHVSWDVQRLLFKSRQKPIAAYQLKART